jgi:hypothetical protein
VSSLSLKAWASVPTSIQYSFKRSPLITEIFHILLQPHYLCPNRNKMIGICPIPNKITGTCPNNTTDLCPNSNKMTGLCRNQNKMCRHLRKNSRVHCVSDAHSLRKSYLFPSDTCTPTSILPLSLTKICLRFVPYVLCLKNDILSATQYFTIAEFFIALSSGC